jgi:hypothetical protein
MSQNGSYYFIRKNRIFQMPISCLKIGIFWKNILKENYKLNNL